MDNGDRIQIEALRAEVRAQTSTIEKLSFQFVAAGEALRLRDAAIDGMLKDHEVRIRSTEKWKYSVPVAALAALGTVVGAILAGK